MSDFDKEAERERLREKYEREQEKRESTERMSELLLKGATMTDAHCGNCGDPIFRYDGEEFCPTCQERVAPGEGGAGGEDVADDPDAQAGADGKKGASASGRGEAEGAGVNADAGHAGANPDARHAGANADAEREENAAQASSGGQDTRSEPVDGAADVETKQPVEPAGQDANGAPGAASGTDRSDGSQGADPSRQWESQSSPSRLSEPRGEAGEGIGAARESLTRTLLTQAREAERCEDPGRAKDHLAAAREAAEALAALSY